MSIIGPIFSADQVEEGALEMLRKWLPTYLADVAAQRGYETIAQPDSWGLASNFDRWPEQGLPAIIATSPGMHGAPEKKGDGTYRGTFLLEINAVVAGTGPAQARKLAQVYAAAIRGALLQRRNLGAEGGRVTDWLDEQFATISVKERRTLMAAAVVLVVQQDELVNWQLGPKGETPPTPVPSTDPTVQETELKPEVSK